MREIKFRGRRMRSSDWIVGAYIPPDFTFWNAPSIADRNFRYEVEPESIGQFTGLVDIGGKEIYEGDILESRASENSLDWKRWEVSFRDGWFEAAYERIRRKKPQYERTCLCEDEITFYGFVVIGNVTDNPELMEGKQ